MGRTLAIAIGIIVVGDVLSTGSRAQNNQQDNQWCAYFTGGPTNCGFATFEQCLKAITGKTGLCDQNPDYVPPAPAKPAPVKRQRHRRHHKASAG